MPISRRPPPPPVPGPRRRTLLRATIAFHEAGHTVATMVLLSWRVIEFVTINGPKEAPGYLLDRRRSRGRLSPKSPEHAKRRARADIVALHAGTWAGVHFENAVAKMRGRQTRHRKEAPIHDIMEAMGLAARLCRDEGKAEKLNDRLGTKARDIVERGWPQVVAIAGALLDKGTVSGTDLWDVARTPKLGADPWIAFDDLVLSLKLPPDELRRLRAKSARERR